MSVNEVIDIIAKAKTVERIVAKITEDGANDKGSLPDLCQDIYMSLLLDNKVVGIFERGQLSYYITRIALNNICSSSSPYYRTYIRPLKSSEAITEKLKTQLETINPKTLKDILSEYAFNDDIMCQEDERTMATKWALSQIPEADRILFCLYLDLGASRKVGTLLGVSHSTILKEMHRIKTMIKSELEKYPYWESIS